jgi:hypothetical protein
MAIGLGVLYCTFTCNLCSAVTRELGIHLDVLITCESGFKLHETKHPKHGTGQTSAKHIDIILAQ